VDSRSRGNDTKVCTNSGPILIIFGIGPGCFYGQRSFRRFIGFWPLNAFFGLKLGFESKNYANLAKKLLPLRGWTINIKSLVISINGCQS